MREQTLQRLQRLRGASNDDIVNGMDELTDIMADAAAAYLTAKKASEKGQAFWTTPGISAMQTETMSEEEPWPHTQGLVICSGEQRLFSGGYCLDGRVDVIIDREADIEWVLCIL